MQILPERTRRGIAVVALVQPGNEAAARHSQCALQIVRHLRRRLVAILRLLFKRLLNHLVQPAGNIPVIRAHAARLFLHLLERHGDRRFPVEGHGSGQHFIEHHAQRIQIALRVRVLAAGLLGRDIVYGAERRLRVRNRARRRVHQPRDAEIRHLHDALLIDEDVLGLNIPVNNVVFMGMVERRQNLQRVAHRLRRREPPFPADDVLERGAVNVLHDDIAHIAVDAHAVHLHDVLMRHLRGGNRLVVEPAHKFPVCLKFGAQNLQRHLAFFDFIPRAVYHGHAAGSDNAQNAIPAGDDFIHGHPPLRQSASP